MGLSRRGEKNSCEAEGVGILGMARSAHAVRAPMRPIQNGVHGRDEARAAAALRPAYSQSMRSQLCQKNSGRSWEPGNPQCGVSNSVESMRPVVPAPPLPLPPSL